MLSIHHTHTLLLQWTHCRSNFAITDEPLLTSWATASPLGRERLWQFTHRKCYKLNVAYKNEGLKSFYNTLVKWWLINPATGSKLLLHSLSCPLLICYSELYLGSSTLLHSSMNLDDILVKSSFSHLQEFLHIISWSCKLSSARCLFWFLYTFVSFLVRAVGGFMSVPAGLEMCACLLTSCLIRDYSKVLRHAAAARWGRSFASSAAWHKCGPCAPQLSWSGILWLCGLFPSENGLLSVDRLCSPARNIWNAS